MGVKVYGADDLITVHFKRGQYEATRESVMLPSYFTIGGNRVAVIDGAGLLEFSP